MTRTLRRILALLPALLALPAAALALPSFGGSPRVDVEVREKVGQESWEAYYHFPHEVAGVELPHGRASYRRAAWGISAAGASWVDAPAAANGDAPERLCFAKPLRELAISFRSDFATRAKDYELNVAMSDGGRLLYTGHLVVRPLARCAAGADVQPLAEPLLHRFRFVTDRGRSIRVGDRAAAGTLDWSPAAGHEETYAYFGPQAGTTGEQAAIVADPQLPAWLRTDLDALIGKLLARFAAETAVALPARPLVLLGFDPKGSGSSFDGGVLDNVVTLAARGDGWQHESDEQRRRWTIRLGHELFHLWDGGVFHADEESEWLSEAAAEAFALRAAWALGALPEAAFARHTVGLANECLAEMDGGPLLTAGARGGWQSWYSCGPTLLWIADRVVERKHPGEGGLGLLFRDMLAESATAGHVYGTGVFLGWLDKLSGDRETVYALQRLIRTGMKRGADDLLQKLVAAGGLRVSLVEPAEATATPEVFEGLLRGALVRCACGGGEPEPGSDCARLAGDARLVRVGDVEVRSDAGAAYGRMRGAALFGRPLRVVAGDDPQPLTLFCDKESLAPGSGKMLRLEDQK